MERATLGGGCFWCLEAGFLMVEGVHEVRSGYAGGDRANPSYEDVCTGRTGHAEVVEVTFDPSVRPYGEILEVFFTMHDPTQLNRQGADVGTQYRSVIFTHDAEQARAARAAIAGLKDAFDEPIVTQVHPLARFYPAEEYHRNYYARNPRQPYCAAVIAPKLAKLRAKVAPWLRRDAAAAPARP